jgi:iron complex outermembrane recepter protein
MFVSVARSILPGLAMRRAHVAGLCTTQDRFDFGKGNVVDQDIGCTPGFGALSLNGRYKPVKGAPMGAFAGYTQTTRVNEPGRAVWIKAQLELD